MSWSRPSTPPLYQPLPQESTPYTPPPPYNPYFINNNTATATITTSTPTISSSNSTRLIWTAAKIIGGVGFLAILIKWGYHLGRKHSTTELIAQVERIRDDRRNRLIRAEESIEEEEEEELEAEANPYSNSRQLGLTEFLLTSQSAPYLISPSVRLAVRRTLFYLLGGVLITGGTVALLTSSSSSLPLFHSRELRRQLSQWKWQLLSFIGSCVGILGVNMIKKENWLVKHAFFLLFHLASGCAVAPLFFLPSPLIGQAGLMTAGVVAAVSTVTLFTPNRNSLYLYALPAVGFSLVLTSAIHSLYRFFFPPTPPLTIYDRASADTYSYLRLYGTMLLFGGYIVLDMQKLIVISMTMEEERRRNERRGRGRRGGAGGERQVDRRRRPYYSENDERKDEMKNDDDNDYDAKGNENFPFTKQSIRNTSTNSTSTQEQRMETPARSQSDQIENRTEEIEMRRLEENESVGNNGNNEERKERTDNEINDDQINENSISLAPRNRSNSLNWLTSSSSPDYMSLSLDFYLDAFNIFLTMLELSVKREQSERERARNNNQQNNGSNEENLNG